MEVLAAVSVPQVLKLAYDALLFSWDQCEKVEGNQTQCHLLIQRCQDLFFEVNKQLSDLALVGKIARERGLAAYLRGLEEACIAVKTTIGRLADKGFAWRLLNQDKIKEELAAAETAIGDALTVFNFGTHLSTQILQLEIASAQKADQEELVARLDNLACSDRKILAALQDDARCQRRLEELIVAFTKHIQRMSQTSPVVPDDHTEAFLLTASSALQRLSGQNASDIPHWAVTGLEVIFDPDDPESCIGKGAFGSIYKGEWNGQVVAVKEMHGHDARLLTPVSLKYIRNEIKIWSQVAHPHLLPFYGACLESGRPFIVTRFCEHGNILEFLRREPNANRVIFLHEISLGMTYLHNQGVIHADLKAVNVLVGDDQKAVITDFGLSRLQNQITSMTGSKPAGTSHWMAPELLDGGLPSKPADVYSFALLAWELYTGLVPFSHLQGAALGYGVITKKERPRRPERMDGPTWEMVEKCWTHDASQRPTFATIQTQLRRILLKGQTIAASAASNAATLSVSESYSRLLASFKALGNSPSARPLEHLNTDIVETAYSKLPAEHEGLSKDPAKSTGEARWSPTANSSPPNLPSGSSFLESMETFGKARMQSWRTTSLKALTDTVNGARPAIDGSPNSSRDGSVDAPSSAPDSTLPETTCQAKALYAYTASPDDPNEISFTKGEILEILDKTGKWWQGRKADGTIGLGPSNYLSIIM